MDNDLGAVLMAKFSEFAVAVLASIAAEQINKAINKRKSRKEEEAEEPKGEHFPKR